MSSSTLLICSPSTSTMRSFGARPAPAAAPPGVSSRTSAPCRSPCAGHRRGGDADARVGRLAGADDLLGDRLRLVDRDGEADADAAALLPAERPAAPRVAMAELMPTTSPRALTRAPPELPGLIAASVWMALKSGLRAPPSPGTSTVRFRALTMPVVTVPDRPSGEPIAMTEVADDERPRLAEGGAGQLTAADLHLQDGEVGDRVAADDLGGISCSPASRRHGDLAAARRPTRRRGCS
jgi:hypothetical protein